MASGNFLSFITALPEGIFNVSLRVVSTHASWLSPDGRDLVVYSPELSAPTPIAECNVIARLADVNLYARDQLWQVDGQPLDAVFHHSAFSSQQSVNFFGVSPQLIRMEQSVMSWNQATAGMSGSYSCGWGSDMEHLNITVLAGKEYL